MTEEEFNANDIELIGKDNLVQIRGEKFTNQPVSLDNHYYTECEFSRCRIVYRGGAFYFDKCTIDSACVWTFAGPARNTVRFIAMLTQFETEDEKGNRHSAADIIINKIKARDVG